MAIVVHFPMGAGGNLVRNIFSLSPGFELLGADRAPVESNKYEFLLDYYQQEVNRTTWLEREWSIRQGLFNRYYNLNVPVYWNPDYKLVYDNHGTITVEDLDHPLQHWNRSGIKNNTITEQIAEWTLRDCQHVFIDVGNLIKQINQIYFSKNHNLQKNFVTMSASWNKQLDTLQKNLSQCLIIDVKHLFSNSGDREIYNLSKMLNLDIDANWIKTIHQTWLQSTREIYYNYYKENLTL